MDLGASLEEVEDGLPDADVGFDAADDDALPAQFLHNLHEVLGTAIAGDVSTALLRDSMGRVIRVKPDESLQGWRVVSIDRTQLDLTSADWGFSSPGAGIDHIIVRDLKLERGPERWPPERRERHGALLSDHAPVEAVVT